MSKENDLKLAEQYFEEGKALEKQNQYEQAMKKHTQASSLYEKWEIWEEWLNVNNEIGRNYYLSGKYDDGIGHLMTVVEIGKRRVGDEHIGIMKNLNSLGICHSNKANYRLAICFFQEGLSICKKNLGDEDPSIATGLNNIGVAHYYNGNSSEAICFFEEALSIRKKILDKENPLIADSLNNIGLCYKVKGDYDIAINHHQEALSIYKKNLDNQHNRIAATLNNLGICYTYKEDYSRSISHQQEALSIYQKKLGNGHPYIAIALNNIGITYNYNGNYDLSISAHQEALSIRKEKLDKEHPDIAESLGNLAICYSNKGDYNLSFSYYEQALFIHKKNPDNERLGKVLALNGLGHCCCFKGDYEPAIRYYQESLIALVPSFHQDTIFHNPILGVYKSGYEFLDALAGKAQGFFELYIFQTQKPKYLQAALSTVHLATALITNIRQSYKTQGSKHTLAAKASKTYNQAIKTTLKTAELYQTLPSIPQHLEFTNIPYTVHGCKDLAFNFSEQSKSILLLSSLKDSEAKATSNIPKELLEKEKQLKIELNYLDKSIATQEAKSDQKDEELISKFQSQHFDYKQEYDQLIEQFEADYPEYFRLKYAVETASVKDLQYYLSKTNPPVTNHQSIIQLISYHIAEEKIYIFTITSNSYQIHTLEKPTNFSQLISDFQDAIALADIDEYMESASILFDLLLLPVLEEIPNTSKLILIPHNELTTLSFDALIDTRKLSETERAKISADCDFSALPYLVKDYDISYHYSATMLLHSVARQEQVAPKPASFVGFAPVSFDGLEDIELALVSNKGQTKVMRSNRAGDKALATLPSTENEVKEVFQLFEEKELDAEAFLYASANKQNLFDNVSKHKYVLIATHGYAQDGNAELSGIYLASKGEVQGEVSDTYSTNYLLHTSEAYHLQLDADLVVLSSCSSGVGKLIAGEGMMAINRGFLYAGASNIIFTHFDIPDASSGKLVKALFEEILEGKNYASALRKAKLEVIQQGLKTPEDWAGYALIGV